MTVGIDVNEDVAMKCMRSVDEIINSFNIEFSSDKDAFLDKLVFFVAVV